MPSHSPLRTRSLLATRARRATAVLVAGVALASAITAGRARAQGETLPSTCPTGTLAFSSHLTNGSMKIGRSASSTGGSATACGSLALGTDGALVATVDRNNVTFAPTSTTVLFLRLPTTIRAAGNLTGPAAIAADGQHVTLTGPVEATASILGAKCTIALTPSLTTDTSGRLTGVPLKDDGTGTMRGKLVANDFAVPAVKSSPTCPLLIAGFTNLTLGLPLSRGQSSITFDVDLKLGI